MGTSHTACNAVDTGAVTQAPTVSCRKSVLNSQPALRPWVDPFGHGLMSPWAPVSLLQPTGILSWCAALQASAARLL
jgi:hypothetical protein